MSQRAFDRLALPVVLLLFLGVLLPGSSHGRAVTLLLRFGSTSTASGLAALGARAVDEAPLALASPTGTTRARVYTPRGAVDPPGIVIIPGVHHLGVDEPRLGRFARAIASSGVVVMTPEIKELTEYVIDPRSVGTIGAAARELAGRVHRRRVGVLGLSFAGGLALLAAADPAWEPYIAFVVALGAHDNLGRVSRFFAEDRIPRPDGTVVDMHAHPYGMLVLVHAHTEAFFDAEDVPLAREVLRLWLWEEQAAAKEKARGLSLAGQDLARRLFDGGDVATRAQILATVTRYDADMRAVSPHGRVGALKVPSFFLHGEGDNVIPASETLWLAQDVPASSLRAALVSPALQHVELHGEPTVRQKWDLIHFMAALLDEAGREPRAP